MQTGKLDDCILNEIPWLDLKTFGNNRNFGNSERDTDNSWDILTKKVQFYCISCEKHEYNAYLSENPYKNLQIDSHNRVSNEIL